MWLVSEYEPVTLFSLKLSAATSSGGKALLAPTPYALKMAMLDAAYRLMGAQAVHVYWPAIRDLAVAYRPPRMALVTNLFARVLKPDRKPEPGAGPFARTIGYREYVHLSDSFCLAWGSASEDDLSWLAALLAGVTYIGKRGGFVQLVRPPEECGASLPEGYVLLNPQGPQAFRRDGLLQMMDDCGPEMTLEHANVHEPKRVRVGHERIMNHVVLPYRLARASKSYTLYERID